jgi:hypothetical protein
MNTLPTHPTELAKRVGKLGERMHSLDQELFSAEREGNTGRRIAVLLERATLWTSYAGLLEAAGKESWTAHGAARTDHRAALNLQAQAEQR